MTEPSPDTLKCPSCNCKHRAKTDIFGNRIEMDGGTSDFDVREIFGITAQCPICREEECTEVVALPCGHVMCKDCYQMMGGFVKHNAMRDDSSEEDCSGILINIRKAGQSCVNRTYHRTCDNKNRYTSMGRYNNRDVEFYIELRTVDNQKWWYLSVSEANGNPSEPPNVIDFYRAKVNPQLAYPSRISWEKTSSQYSRLPNPKSSASSLEGREL